jgi:hypothetical protein
MARSVPAMATDGVVDGDSVGVLHEGRGVTGAPPHTNGYRSTRSIGSPKKENRWRRGKAPAGLWWMENGAGGSGSFSVAMRSSRACTRDETAAGVSSRRWPREMKTREAAAWLISGEDDWHARAAWTSPRRPMHARDRLTRPVAHRASVMAVGVGQGKFVAKLLIRGPLEKRRHGWLMGARGGRCRDRQGVGEAA